MKHSLSIFILIIFLVVFFWIIPLKAKTCANFGSQKRAQAYFNSNVVKHSQLDRDNDWVACEALK